MKHFSKERKAVFLLLLSLSTFLSSCLTEYLEESSSEKANSIYSDQSEFSEEIISKESSYDSNDASIEENLSEIFNSSKLHFSSEEQFSTDNSDISYSKEEPLHSSEDYSSISEDNQSVEQKPEASSEESETDISNDFITIESASERFKDKFTDGEIISTENSYISPFVNVSLKEITFEGKLYFVQDIYIKDIQCISAGFAGTEFGKKYNDYVFDMVEDYKQKGYGIVGAINGDYCGLDGKGAIIRNGKLYGSGIAENTICVLYKNGIMEIIPKNDFDAQTELQKGAWHAWDFGPSFLDENGNAITEFTEKTDISKSNPRTVLGYFEPGHYCFVTAGGRANDKAYGVSFKQISRFMSSLGCQIAYNLDGGKSAVMVFGNKISNEEYQGIGRKISDIVFIRDLTI